MWATLLLSLTGPIVIRVLSTLGLGVVSYVGLNSVVTLAYNQIQANFSSLPPELGQFLFLSGLPQGMGIILSALVARIAMMQLSKIQKL
ncbi:MAG: DUF2523 domain-containing protein [Gallionellaceae bacterium]|nr:DUF2523 domain-containing protein [Gallionellaceae bacterium]